MENRNVPSFQFSPNAQGQIRAISYGNGATTDYTYGQDLRLSRILTRSPANPQTGTLQDLNYIFDKNGNLTTLNDNLRSNIRTYAYDELDRLSEARNLPAPAGGYTDFFYQYNSIGNMVYKSDLGTMTYGQNAGPHALTQAGGYTYQYDVNGNMIVGKNKTLAYDAENRLLEVNESGIITLFTYDGDGGRVKKASGENSTIYIGSLFEKDSSGKATKHIFAGSNRVCTVTKDEGSGTTDVSYYHLDHLGSSNIITDSSGNLAEHYEYTPYGSIAVQELVSRPSSLVHHKFTGKELDATGLYFYGARYYDPEIGRFISADTIVQEPLNPQTLNRYSYCGNNPINYVDPSGHFWVIPLIIAVVKGALIGAAIGAGFAAATGGDIWKGALFGAIGGAVFAGFSTLAQTAIRFVTVPGGIGPMTAGATSASNILSAVVGGAASGAAIAGVSGGDVGRGALIGGAVAGSISLIGEAASLMRAKGVEQSRLDPRNSSGKSAGVKGDGVKLGGGRYNPYGSNDPSPLGGRQGGVGEIFKMPYKPDSIPDHIVETYAGPHDFLNSWTYDPSTGNLRNLNMFEKFISTFTNPLNVAIATPIAVSSALPSIMVVPPVIIYGQSHWNEDGQAILNE